MASLGQMLGFGSNPIYQAISPFKNTIANAGLGLMSGKNWTQGFQNAAAGAIHGSQVDDERQARLQEEEQKQAQLNQTIEWMRSEGFDDLVAAADSGVPIPNLYQEAWKRKYGGGDGQESFFGNIVPMQDESGEIIFGQASNRGRWQPLQGAEGMKPAPTTKTQDIGTHIITFDVHGNELFRTPKNNQQAAFDSAYGGEAGTAAAKRIEQLPGVIAKADNMLGTIDGILNDPALDASTGWLSWMQGIPGTDQYRFGQRALQLQGQAFLQAFESLKGGGQITQIEGEKATQAIGRLSTAQHPDDYRAALEELKQIINAAKMRAMQGAGMSPAPAGAVPDVDAILRGYGL
jgi:hypothetical protein